LRDMPRRWDEEGFQVPGRKTGPSMLQQYSDGEGRGGGSARGSQRPARPPSGQDVAESESYHGSSGSDGFESSESEGSSRSISPAQERHISRRPHHDRKEVSRIEFKDAAERKKEEYFRNNETVRRTGLGGAKYPAPGDIWGPDGFRKNEFGPVPRSERASHTGHSSVQGASRSHKRRRGRSTSRDKSRSNSRSDEDPESPDRDSSHHRSRDGDARSGGSRRSDRGGGRSRSRPSQRGSSRCDSHRSKKGSSTSRFSSVRGGGPRRYADPGRFQTEHWVIPRSLPGSSRQ